MYSHLTDQFPPVTRTPAAIAALKGDICGSDAEWNIQTEKPTILGISDGTTHVSAPADSAINLIREYHERYPDLIWVGHNFVQADLFVFRDLGIDIPVDHIEDTIIHHWLCNMNLCKGTKSDEDEGDKRGRGFMNMWTMASMYSDYPNWKDCRESECTGPCDKHDPFWYNAMDCYVPLVCLPKMMEVERLRGIDHLYPLHRDLMHVLGKWSREGIFTQQEYVAKLRAQFQADKRAIYDKSVKVQPASLPFNPDSPLQVKEYFRSQKIALENTQEATIRDTLADHPESLVLKQLLSYKELGDGADRWYAPRRWTGKEWDGFVDESGFIHPHFGPFTSSGRLQCAGPNMQNVAKRRVDRITGESVGKRVRRAVIAPEGYLLYRADFKNAENRTYLWLAGYHDLPEEDFHSWVAGVMNLKPTDEFVLSIGGGKIREAAKTIVHATDYLEGLKLLRPEELNRPRIVNEVAAGARVVFPDWKVFGKVVTLTGINLAERAFGSATTANRKRALDGQMIYFRRFEKILGLYKMISAQCERESAVIPPHGYYHASYGYEEDRLKQAASIWGSQPVAHFMKIACIRADSHPRLIPRLTVHDELLIYADCCYDPKDVKKWIEECMLFTTKEIPGFILPIDVSYSPYDREREVKESNWADQQEIV